MLYNIPVNRSRATGLTGKLIMQQDYSFEPIGPADGSEIIDLFNHYIGNSYAAYPEQPVPYAFFSHLLEACRGYPTVVVRKPSGKLAGFGLLRPHNPMPVFRRTAEVTYFLVPGETGRGLGTRMLAYLLDAGKENGITTVLASISSLNEGSIRFHQRHGFVECGRFLRVAEKKGKTFDTVWMQKFL